MEVVASPRGTPVHRRPLQLLGSALLAAGVGLAAPSSAGAQPSLDEAQAHFARGAELYDENNFRGALIEFQRAYELAPSYKILFNIGQVEMELQNYAGAMRAYSRYLREGGPDVPAARVTAVHQELERLKGRVGEITIETTAGAEILIDEISIGFAPLPEPALVNAGRHHISVHVSGREPVSRFVDLAGRQQITVALANDGAARPAGPVGASAGRDDRGEGGSSKRAMLIGWSVTGALAVTTGVFAVMAYSASTDLEDLRNTFPVTKDELDDQASRQQTLSILADGFAAATLVAGGVSLYLTLTQKPAEAEKPGKLSLRVSPTGAFVTGAF
jgi:hypothetical protein